MRKAGMITMHKIITSGTGTNSIVFGNEERKYELLESVEPNKVAAFELRVENDPNTTFMEFQIDITEDMTSEQVFAAGLKHAQTNVSQLTDINDYSRKHLTEQLKQVSEEFTENDFAKAVEQLGDNTELEQ